MKVLVTGAKGQVGSELIRKGQKLGLQMIAASHADLDITDQALVNISLTQHAPDIVINTAAYTAVDKAEVEQDRTHAINSHGPTHLAKTCAKLDIPLLHISTDYIFDGDNDKPYREEDKPNPQGVYGQSKLAGDMAVAQNIEQHIILRVAWVFGACGNNFVRTMLRLGKEHNELRVVADQFGGPTWAGDIATTLLTIAQRHGNGKQIKWGTYHYNGNPAVSWYEFAQTVFTEAVTLGMLASPPVVIPITSAEYPTPAQRPKNSVLNCNKIKQHLAIDQPDWHLGLKNTLHEWQTTLQKRG